MEALFFGFPDSFQAGLADHAQAGWMSEYCKSLKEES